MIQLFFLCLLLIYYWYFYASFTKPVARPSTELIEKPQPFNFEFKSKQPNQFEFVINGDTVWEHELPADIFVIHEGKILATDPCYRIPDGNLVEAKGKPLYDYLQENPESKNNLNFIDNSTFTIQNGSVYYFRCLQNRIENIGMCPSGTIFKIDGCQPVNLCTDQPDGTLFPHPISNRYIACTNGSEKVLSCPKDTVFNHHRCESIKNLNHYCKHFSEPFILDEKTLIECVNEKPVYTTCRSGMKFINHNYCEPSDCYGLPDDTKLPLPEKEMKPFKFTPGYMICENNSIRETVECPQKWDENFTEENLLFLPMVYDKNNKICSIPKFCENVFSDDPDTIVPLHNYVKKFRNWEWNKFYDDSAGYYCENNSRKRKTVEGGSLISKRFKIEPICGPDVPRYLPVFGQLDDYYDCDTKQVICCSVNEENENRYFNGKTCLKMPENYFDYMGLPLFKFDSLNFESWIKPWDYSGDKKINCREPESKFLQLYNICSHPDCENYAFVSQIPNMTILLPREQRARCKFYESEKVLKKEPVDFDYHFWNQKIIYNDEEEEEVEKPCKPGQKLETGNFIWDTTIFATCNVNQPFVFCPSMKTENIIPTSSGYYACEPPNATYYEFYKVDEWTRFETNEIKRILPLNWNEDEPHYIRINKKRGTETETLFQEGLEIPEEERIYLITNKPIKIEPRIRVTYPPNVAFEYDNENGMRTHVSTPDQGYLTKSKKFTNVALSFPKYIPEPLMDGFEVNLHV